MKYSILITVYNKEKYLKRCLDSVTQQKFKDYTIIIVDDGSTDNSAKIIKEYQEKYKNIEYYYKENTGVADTRNFAISKVKSEYFTFVDADDYISTRLLKVLDRYAINNIDLVSFSCFLAFPDSNIFIRSLKEEFYCLSGKETFIKYYNGIKLELIDVPWGYLYRTAFFKEHEFQYLYGTEHEDVSLTPIIICSAKKVTSLKFKGYYYVDNDDSITHNNDTQQKRIIDKLTHYKILMQFLEKQDFSEEVLYELRFSILYRILHMFLEVDFKNVKYFINQLKVLNIPNLLPNKSKTQKLSIWLFKTFPLIFIIYYLTYIYPFDDYYILPNNIYHFFLEMQRYGANKYHNIVTDKHKSYYNMRISRAWLYWSNIIKHLPLLLDKTYIKLQCLELVITTKCNLKCKHCANLIPLYNNREKNIPYEELEKQIDSLLEVIDEIEKFRVLGGEPFLHPELNLVLKKLIDSSKIKKIIVVTNSTIKPTNPLLIEILRNPKIVVKANDYKLNAHKYKAMCRFFKTNKIKLEIYDYLQDTNWLDYGNTQKQNKEESKLIKQFNLCGKNRKCLNYFKGKLHLCPRSAHLMHLGIIKNNEQEYVDLLDETIDIATKKMKIINLKNNMKYISACDYCNMATSNAKPIKPAIQLKKFL